MSMRRSCWPRAAPSNWVSRITRGELREQAEQLATRFEQAFWCEELGTYAMALDGEKAPCRVRASNAGRCCSAASPEPDRAARVAAGLMQPDCFSGWGVRTVSTAELRYNPMSYHNGSVWPHDNALIALGLSRYRAKGDVTRIFRALFDAATYFELHRLPELFCGFPRYAGRGPTLYPVACAPQAWSAGAFFALLQASLGIKQDPWKKEIRFQSPTLPNFLDEVELTGLAAGDGSVDVRGSPPRRPNLAGGVANARTCRRKDGAGGLKMTAASHGTPEAVPLARQRSISSRIALLLDVDGTLARSRADAG